MICKDDRNTESAGGFDRSQSMDMDDVERLQLKELPKPPVRQPGIDRLVPGEWCPVHLHPMKFALTRAFICYGKRDDMHLMPLFDKGFAQFNDVGRNPTDVGIKVDRDQSNTHGNMPPSLGVLWNGEP